MHHLYRYFKKRIIFEVFLRRVVLVSNTIIAAFLENLDDINGANTSLWCKEEVFFIENSNVRIDELILVLFLLLKHTLRLFYPNFFKLFFSLNFSTLKFNNINILRRVHLVTESINKMTLIDIPAVNRKLGDSECIFSHIKWSLEDHSALFIPNLKQVCRVVRRNDILLISSVMVHAFETSVSNFQKYCLKITAIVSARVLYYLV